MKARSDQYRCALLAWRIFVIERYPSAEFEPHKHGGVGAWVSYGKHRLIVGRHDERREGWIAKKDLAK